MPLEVLHITLVLHRSRPAVERAQIPALAGRGIGLSRAEAVLAGLELADRGLALLANAGRGAPFREERGLPLPFAKS